MTTKPQNDVQNHLASRAQGEAPAQELVFDPLTGELTLIEPGAARPNPDALTLDQIAADGFFGEVA